MYPPDDERHGWVLRGVAHLSEHDDSHFAGADDVRHVMLAALARFGQEPVRTDVYPLSEQLYERVMQDRLEDWHDLDDGSVRHNVLGQLLCTAQMSGSCLWYHVSTAPNDRHGSVESRPGNLALYIRLHERHCALLDRVLPQRFGDNGFTIDVLARSVHFAARVTDANPILPTVEQFFDEGVPMVMHSPELCVGVTV